MISKAIDRSSKTSQYLGKTTWMLVIVLVVVVLFQQCAPSGRFDLSSSGKYELPFDERKIRINSKYLQADDNGILKAAKGLALSILINNQCVRDLCTMGEGDFGGNTSVNTGGKTDTSQAWSCSLYEQQALPELAEHTQYYQSKLDRAMSEKSLEQLIYTNPIDNECILGLAQEEQLVLAGFNDAKIDEQQYFLDTIKYENGIHIVPTAGLTPVKVGIVDSGYANHEDLPAPAVRKDMRMLTSKQYDTRDCPEPYDDYVGHGTAVASIIAAVPNNNLGLVGLAPNAQIYSYMVGRCSDGQSNVSAVGNAINMAVADGVEVINLSLITYGNSFALQQAVVTALNADITLVVAAGNSNQDISPDGYELYPANYSDIYLGVIAVSAVGVEGPDGLIEKDGDPWQLASFSNFGRGVKVAAPGVDIPVANGKKCNNCSGYRQDSGTSFSAPFVTAAVAYSIGFLKANNLDYSPEYIDRLVADYGSQKYDQLSSKQAGAALDWERLAKALKKLTVEDGPPSPLSVSYDFQPGNDTRPPQVIVGVRLNDSVALHPGARLGIYDGTCGGTTQSCLIKDVDIVDPSGYYTFTLERNDLVAMIPEKSDPNFALNLQVAIHYPRVNQVDASGNPLNYYVAHGIDASQIKNIREIDSSVSSSSLIGEVTSIRMDMQYYYVKGWACFEGSNDMVRVGLVDGLTGAAIATRYAYTYTGMTPHIPIDSPKWSSGSFSAGSQSLSDRPYVIPFFATGIQVEYGVANVFTYNAGLESTAPQNVVPCKTLTASHGFEFVVPVDQIEREGLEERVFNIKATANNRWGKFELLVKDDQDSSTFTFPDVNFEKTMNHNISVDREQQASSYVFDGFLCSESPTPIEAEVSTNLSGLRAAIYQNSPFVKSASGGRKDLKFGFYETGFLHDPTFTTIHATQVYTADIRIGAGGSTTYSTVEDYIQAISQNTINVTLGASEHEVFVADSSDLPGEFDYANDIINILDGYSPVFNTRAEIQEVRNFHRVKSYEPTAFGLLEDLTPTQVRNLEAAEKKVDTAIEAKVNALNLYQYGVGSLIPVTYYAPYSDSLSFGGSQLDQQLDLYKTDRAFSAFRSSPSSSISRLPHWDAYDWGADFSTELIGYEINVAGPIGTYLKETYKVSYLLRETKKYEVPQSTYTVGMGTTHMAVDIANTSSCGGGKFRHNINYTVSDIEEYAPRIMYYRGGFWVSQFAPRDPKNIPPPSVYMKRLPLELRFFQDGRLILHIESDAADNWVPVIYPFHRENYL